MRIGPDLGVKDELVARPGVIHCRSFNDAILYCNAFRPSIGLDDASFIGDTATTAPAV